MVDADWRPHGDICDSRFLRCGDLSAGAAGPRTCRVGIRRCADDPQRYSRRANRLAKHRRHANRLDLGTWRSEEHTSELQSLMRISYAVFCLKKKTNTKNITITEYTITTT